MTIFFYEKAKEFELLLVINAHNNASMYHLIQYKISVSFIDK